MSTKSTSNAHGADALLESIELPQPVRSSLALFLESAKSAFGESLSSILLYGSAAEGRLRVTSDVNVLLVLRTFDASAADRLRGAYCAAHAAVRLVAMFVQESELKASADLFAVKFLDIARRHRVLYGINPFADDQPSRQALVHRLKQTLLNLSLRLRESYVLQGASEAGMARTIAENVGPLRASAAALLDLRGDRAGSPKQALQKIVESLPGDNWSELLARLSMAREKRALPQGEVGDTFMRLQKLTSHLRAEAEKLA